MPRLSQEKIDEIRQGANIVEIVSEYIPLTKRGKNYVGVCPFHQDHSPSMSVSEERQMFKCFSCGIAGNVFKFVSEFENISYIESIAKVAEKIGVSIIIDSSYKKEEKFSKEHEIMNLAMLYFKNNINTTHGEPARKYLKERGLDETIQQEFDVGLSLQNNSMFEFLKKKKISEKDMANLGLINQNGLEYTDIFKNRIIFPIHDAMGRVVGFIGRVYDSNIGPKYLNSKETQIFRKGNILFNYHRAKDAVRLAKTLIIVEGNMDAIRMSSCGFKNTVALQGTSLTKEQIEWINRLHCSVILMLDNDTAGENATLQNGALLESAGIQVDVVRLSGEKDPDEYIVKNGISAMEENLKHPISYLEFKLKILKQSKNLEDTKELADYIKDVLETLKGKDEITIDVTLNRLVKDYNLSYDVLKSQLKTEEKEILPPILTEVSTTKKSKKRYDVSAEHILYFMMNDAKYIKKYKTDLGFFKEELYRGIASEILYYYEQKKQIVFADFLSYIESSPLKEEIYHIIEGIKEDNIDETSMDDYIFIIKSNMLKEKMVELKRNQKETIDVHKKENIGMEIVQIMKKIQEMKIERSVKNDKI